MTEQLHALRAERSRLIAEQNSIRAAICSLEKRLKPLELAEMGLSIGDQIDVRVPYQKPEKWVRGRVVECAIETVSDSTFCYPVVHVARGGARNGVVAVNGSVGWRFRS